MEHNLDQRRMHPISLEDTSINLARKIRINILSKWLRTTLFPLTKEGRKRNVGGDNKRGGLLLEYYPGHNTNVLLVLVEIVSLNKSACTTCTRTTCVGVMQI